jgi:hypothetical protein
LSPRANSVLRQSPRIERASASCPAATFQKTVKNSVKNAPDFWAHLVVNQKFAPKDVCAFVENIKTADFRCSRKSTVSSTKLNTYAQTSIFAFFSFAPTRPKNRYFCMQTFESRLGRSCY